MSGYRKQQGCAGSRARGPLQLPKSLLGVSETWEWGQWKGLDSQSLSHDPFIFIFY